MTNQIHGHEVMEMMVASRETYSKDSLRAAILAKFGPDALFHTCSADNLSPDQLIEFLAEREVHPFTRWIFHHWTRFVITNPAAL